MNKKLFYISLFFFILYGLISFVNHYVFRTYALDLGAYTNALFDYRNFQLNDSMVFKSTPENLLADHFDLYLPLLAPLSFVFETYTLLIVQVIAIIFGGIGIYNLIKYQSKNTRLALSSSIYFFTFFGVFSALSFDYHSNVIASCLAVWFILYSLKKKLFPALIIFILILIGKENMSLWMCFVSLGLLAINFKDKYLVIFFTGTTIFSIIYFFIITSIIMPALSNSGNFHHFHYSSIGNTMSEAFIYIITNPLEALKMMFINHNNSEFGDYVKLELWVLLSLSGLLIMLRKPQYLIMLIPIFFQKLFHDNYSMWGINGQYSIEFAPIFAIAIFNVLVLVKNNKTRFILTTLVITLNIVATIRIMDNTIFYTNKSQIRFYKTDHYTRDFNISNAYESINQIPQNSVVSAQSIFLPHLALRDNIYQFPTILNAEYIIYAPTEGAFPLSESEFKAKTNSLLNSNEWENISDNPEIIVLKRL